MTLEALRIDIARAGRILFAQGIVDAFGHVSCRHPERLDCFLMSRSRAPSLVMPEDVIEHDLDGDPVGRPGARVFLERFIHAEMYRARPDVCAIVHSHCSSVLPFTVVADKALRPVCHVCGFLEGIGVPFDVAEHAGDGSDLLIRDGRLGQALARHMADRNVVLMRGHGFTAVGATLAQAVFRAVYTGINSQIQLAALQLGSPRYLSTREAIACEDTTLGQIDRVWDLWVSRYGDLI